MTDQSSHKNKKPPTLSMLHLPGGGGLGPLMGEILVRLEDLLEAPTMEIFPAADGVSIGGIYIAALYTPHTDDPRKPLFTAREAQSIVLAKLPEFFSPHKNRLAKMLATNGANIVQTLLDPSSRDEMIFEDISLTCDELRKSAPRLKDDIDRLEALAKRRWPSKDNLQKVFTICNTLRNIDSGLEEKAGIVLSHVRNRTQNASRLSTLFRQAALGGSEIVKKRTIGHLYDPGVQKKTYTALFGDRRMADCLRTVFISAHALVENQKFTFFCRKQGILQKEPAVNEQVSHNNHTLVDAVMSTSAHQLAVPPHETEDGVLFIDAAISHNYTASVMNVKRAVRAENPEANVNLFVLNTGNDVIKGAGKEKMMKRMIDLNALGNMMDGTQLAQISGYNMSDAKTVCTDELGTDSIIEITPRLIPRNAQEKAEFPSREPLDTSPAQMEKVVRAAERTVFEQDEQIRAMALRLAENLLSLGHWDEERFQRISDKIQSAPPPPFENAHPPRKTDIFSEVMAEQNKKLSWKLTKWFGQAVAVLGIGMHAVNDNKISPQVIVPHHAQKQDRSADRGPTPPAA